MDVKCPHCGKVIELVGAKELSDDYQLGPNTVHHARQQGRFPEPWMSFANRNIWLKRDVDAFSKARSEVRVEQHLEGLLKSLDRLPESDREAAERLLIERIHVPEKTKRGG